MVNPVVCNYITGYFTDSPDVVVNVITRQATYDRATLGFKYYDLPIIMKDNPTSGQPSMQATRNLRITVESQNDNAHEAGSKTVVVYNIDGKFPNSSVGNVYVNDPDDWDQHEKTYEFVQHQDHFMYVYIFLS